MTVESDELRWMSSWISSMLIETASSGGIVSLHYTIIAALLLELYGQGKIIIERRSRDVLAEMTRIRESNLILASTRTIQCQEIASILESVGISIDRDSLALLIESDDAMLIDVIRQLHDLVEGPVEDEALVDDEFDETVARERLPPIGHTPALSNEVPYVPYADEPVYRTDMAVLGEIYDIGTSGAIQSPQLFGFLGHTLQECLELRHEQASSILTLKLHVLEHVISHGISDNNFAGIIRWFQLLLDQLRLWVSFLQPHSQDLCVMITLISGGWSSKSKTVRQISLQVVESLASFLEDKDRTIVVYGATQWSRYMEDLKACLSSCCVDRLVSVFMLVSDGLPINLLLLNHDLGLSFGSRGFCEALAKTSIFFSDNKTHLFNFVNECMSKGKQNPKLLEKFDSRFFQVIIQLALENCDALSDYNVYLSAIVLLAESWITVPSAIETVIEHMMQAEEEDKVQESATSGAILSSFKIGCRMNSSAVQVTTMACMFHLLDELTARSSSCTPQLYKSIVFSLIENRDNELLSSFITENLSEFIEKHPRVPVSFLVAPLMKQVEIRGYSNLDFDFFLALSSHKMLSIDSGIQMLEMFGKISIHDSIYARLARIPALVIAARWSEEIDVHNALSRMAISAINLLGTNDAKAMKVVDTVSLGDSTESSQLNVERDSVIAIRRALVLECVEKFLNTTGTSLAQARPVWAKAILEYSESYTTRYKREPYPSLRDIVHVAVKVRNVHEPVEASVPSGDCLIVVEADSGEEKFEDTKCDPPHDYTKPSESPTMIAMEPSDDMAHRSVSEASRIDSPAGDDVAPASVSASITKAKEHELLLLQKASLDIEKIQMQRAAAAERKAADEKCERLRSEAVKSKLRRRYNSTLQTPTNRFPETTSNIPISKDTALKDILPPPPTLPTLPTTGKAIVTHAVTRPRDVLPDLNWGELESLEAAIVAFARDKKVLRRLFKAYASIHDGAAGKSFDALKDHGTTLGITEWLFFVKEYQLLESKRALSLQFFHFAVRGHPAQRMDLPHFLSALRLLVISGLAPKSNINVDGTLIAESDRIANFLNHVRAVAKEASMSVRKDGHSFDSYLRLDIAQWERREIVARKSNRIEPIPYTEIEIRDLEANLEKNPSTVLPEGLATQKIPIYQISAGVRLVVSDSAAIVLELLDEIVFNSLIGIHLLPCIGSKLVINQSTLSVAAELRGLAKFNRDQATLLMAGQSGNNLKPPPSLMREGLLPSTNKSKLIDSAAPRVKQIKTYKNNVLSAYPREKRGMVVMVLKILNEIIGCVTGGSTQISNSGTELDKRPVPRDKTVNADAASMKVKEAVAARRLRRRKRKLKHQLEEMRIVKEHEAEIAEVENRRKEVLEREKQHIAEAITAKQRIEQRAKVLEFKRQRELKREAEELEKQQAQARAQAVKLEELRLYRAKRKRELATKSNSNSINLDVELVRGSIPRSDLAADELPTSTGLSLI